MLRIKVCGMKDPVNLEVIGKLQVDFFGFLFYPGSQRFIGTNPGENLFSKIPKRILITGVFVNEQPGTVIERARQYCLDLVQLHGEESPEYCRFLHNEGISIIKAFGIGEEFDFNKLIHYEEICNFFLFDSAAGSGGSGLKFDWSCIKEYRLRTPFFLSGGIGPGDAELILKLKHEKLFGIDINSRFESAPGLKNTRLVETFINDIKGIQNQ